ncbi:pimeloyl-ACP methyl ester carboxylesterase [Kribbella aluminosa]|uniref:Pimeloyl-ACP methyl ester carboxylesterase n=1 Tax=Kribbella aluminosa TaxID=416017 RepID=A0ABS4UXM6_9ACTN|nr:alpha/beta hydrolase [Kribbella aluminosa]MBP2356392.1 pimeloyl-ACP methyl ester carboxylesterase [Kribbella aluminosa]
MSADLTQGAVTSRDGTEIGYYKTGRGPAVVVLHGSMESATSHTLFAQELADEFTVYLPDRRGRGLSGPHRPDHGVRTEVEDLDAVLTVAGAERAFGISAGGAVVLEAARTLSSLKQVALYEPALVADGAPHREWLARFDQQIARGDIAGAMVTSMFGFELAPGFLKVVPRGVLRWATEKMLAKDARQAADGAVLLRDLAPTIHAEGTIVAELGGTFEKFRTVDADVLLLGGTKGLRGLQPGRDTLEKVLPNVRRIEFDGYDHGAASDPGGVNPAGKPEAVRRIAAEVKAFLKRS